MQHSVLQLTLKTEQARQFVVDLGKDGTRFVKLLLDYSKFHNKKNVSVEVRVAGHSGHSGRQGLLPKDCYIVSGEGDYMVWRIGLERFGLVPDFAQQRALELVSGGKALLARC